MNGITTAVVEVDLPPEAKDDPVTWMQKNVRGVYAVRSVSRCNCEQCSRDDAAHEWLK